MIILKTPREIDIMREAGKIVALTHEELKKHVKPGITTKELDRIAEEFIQSKGATPSFKGYNGFPASICASVNAQVVHGIPNDKPLEEGDIISIDIGAFYKGYCADAARTFPVGNISSEAAELIDAAKESFYESLKYSRLGYRISDISHAIQSYVESRGFSVVKSFVGHGIGQRMHEDPQVPNFGLPGMGPRLRPGMTLAVEPMVNQGTEEVEILEDGWTVLTKDRLLSAHYENTIAITEEDPLILTLEERE